MEVSRWSPLFSLGLCGAMHQRIEVFRTGRLETGPLFAVQAFLRRPLNGERRAEEEGEEGTAPGDLADHTEGLA